MPELPEVETVCRGLAQTIIGDKFLSVTQKREGLRTPFPENMAAILEGRKIKSVARRAKYILIGLDSDVSLIVHLGMSGKLVVSEDNTIYQEKKHDHVIFKTSTGKTITYNDPRRFGLIDIVKNSDINHHKLFSHLGVEPLSEDFTSEYFCSYIKNKNQNIKVLIMDQSFVVGVGNIYASESLFSSKICPKRPANSINQVEAKLLIKEIRNVLNAAIESGGSTLRDYVRSSGDAGYFQHYFNVYNKEGKPCSKCATEIVKIKQAGRATYYCPSCQK